MRFRRKLWVDTRLQLSFLGFFIGLAALSISVVFYANHLFFNKVFLEAKILGLPPTHFFFQFLEGQREVMRVIFFLTSLIIFSTMTLGGLILSNRVSGPLLRLIDHMRKVGKGKDVPPIHFRKGDYFMELAEVCNVVVDRLGQKAPPSQQSSSKK